MTHRQLLGGFAGLLLLVFGLRAAAQTGAPASVIRDGDRIIFVGDSITGQGTLGGPNAWVQLIGEGIAMVRPDAKPTLIGLGGSGSTVNSWLGFEKRSRSGPLALDAKNIDVGKSLDGGAGIVVFMLGMNDVLGPGTKDTPEALDQWIGKYSDLIDRIRERSHPRVVALATITPCTEDPASPKNLVLDKMNQRLAALAKEKGYLLLPTREASFQIRAEARVYNPRFHITRDLVHPGSAGHLAIAVGMLRGLGEPEAAAKLMAAHASTFRPADAKLPALTYDLTRLPGSPDNPKQRFAVVYRWVSDTPPDGLQVKVDLPSGWTATPATSTAAAGTIELEGALDRAVSTVSLIATSANETRRCDIKLPAGWRIAVGKCRGRGWERNSIFTPEKERQPIDGKLAMGEGLTTPVAFEMGDPGAWQLYVPSFEYVGGDDPDSVDMAAVTYFTFHDMAYGARWIYSPGERPVEVAMTTRGFSGTYSLEVWLDGKALYAGKLLGEPKHRADASATLHKGWNLLVFKSTFIQWQWQFNIALAGQNGDDLSDLRYATYPPAP